jgi:hypothetical protein
MAGCRAIRSAVNGIGGSVTCHLNFGYCTPVSAFFYLLFNFDMVFRRILGLRLRGLDCPNHAGYK